MKIAIGILLLLGSVQSVSLQQKTLGQIKDSNITLDPQKAEALNAFQAAVELETKEKHGYNETKKMLMDLQKQQIAQAFSNKTSYELQAEEIDREEESAGNVVQQEKSEVLQQANALMEKNGTMAFQNNDDEMLWKNKAQKNVDDFDAYSNFMNSKFGSAPAAEQAKVVEVKKDNQTQNSVVQQQSQQNQTQNISANKTNKESGNATQSVSEPTPQVAAQSLTNATKNLDLNSTAEKAKTLKVNETNAVDDSQQMHHIVDKVLRESDAENENLDDIVKRVQTDDEKEQKVLNEVKTEQAIQKQNEKRMNEIEKQEIIAQENQKQDNATANITVSLPQKNQTTNVTTNVQTASNASISATPSPSQNNQTLNLTAVAGQNSTMMEQALYGVIQKYAAKQEERTQNLIEEQNKQLQDIEQRLLEKQLTKTAERRISVSFGGGIAQAAGQALADEEDAKDDVLSALNEISGLDKDDRKKVFVLAEEGLKN